MTSSAKVLQFPLAGISRDTEFRKAYVPSENVAFSTPFSVNVLGECTFAERKRGGSRPGLRKLTGTTTDSTATICWPNGDCMMWPNMDNITTNLPTTSHSAPDGSLFADPHKKFTPYATKGFAPPNVNVGALYRARLFVKSGSEWYASRTGDVGDWDYGGDMEDVCRATMGNVGLASCNGENITAMIPVSDKYMYIATNRALWRLDGEPTTGTITQVSPFVGCVSSDAWCYDGTRVWFIGSRGMYSVVQGEPPKNASVHLPIEFENVTSAILAYDKKSNGIHIFATNTTGQLQTANDWYFDIGNSAFWKMSYPVAMRPTAVANVFVDNTNVTAFLGQDGCWRYPCDTQTTDDGAAITSKVVIGPIRMSSRDDVNGMLSEISANTAVGSSVVRCDIYTARTPEDAAYAAAAGWTTVGFNFASGWNNVVRPRARGAWVAFLLSSTGRWGYESITSVCKSLGRLR